MAGKCNSSLGVDAGGFAKVSRFACRVRIFTVWDFRVFRDFRVENRMLDPGLDASIDGAWGWMKNGTMLTAEQQHGQSLLANKHKTKEVRAHQR